VTYVMVDVEADGPIPGDYSMVCFAAIVVEDALDRTFYARTRPVSDRWNPEALAISGFTREQTLAFDDPATVMRDFAVWVRAVAPKRAVFVADNNGFDWSFINWYFHHFIGENPFGYSSMNLNCLYKGMTNDLFVSLRPLRRTPHTHDPLDDARGNAEAMLAMRDRGLNVRLGRPAGP